MTLLQALKASSVHAANGYAANGDDLHILAVFVSGETNEDDQLFFYDLPCPSVHMASGIYAQSAALRTRIYDSVPTLGNVDDYKTMKAACQKAGIATWKPATTRDIAAYVPPHGYLTYKRSRHADIIEVHKH